MRWDSLRHQGAEQAGLFGTEVALRTFDTPEFAGMEFYEVRARSIVNRVPSASRMPFHWTINPYRGCTHACTYCLDGDTRILMVDGRTRRLAELQVGDQVFGTRRDAQQRRYVPTTVFAHWSVTKPAHRIRLEDGTELIASGDHQFLTDDGWRYVRGRGVIPIGRSGLAVGDRVVGPGRRIDQPIPGMAIPATALLEVVSMEPLEGTQQLYDITTGTGDFIADGVVSHNCFARKTHTYLDLDAGRDFDSRIIVKVNAPELLRKELARTTWAGEHIAMGTNTDPYQRAEGRYRLMPGIITALRDARNPFSILTKGTLILRDLDLLRSAAEVTDVSVNLSIGSIDSRLWRQVESGTPSPRARLDACRRLTDAGIGCGVLMAPILPYLTDSPQQLDRTVREIAEAGARSVTPLVLHLRSGAREWFLAWLSREHPELVPAYSRLYGRGAYAPKSYQRDIAAQVREAAVRYGIGTRPPMHTRQPDSPVLPESAGEPQPEQLRLL
ncbi:MAG: Rv2578c family radical SAM protein [Nocardioidaceae bacterium]